MAISETILKRVVQHIWKVLFPPKDGYEYHKKDKNPRFIQINIYIVWGSKKRGPQEIQNEVHNYED